MASSIAVWRQGAGFPLVMIHGDFSTGRDAWQRQMSTIADRDLIVVDRRGYGASPADRDAYTIEGDAADVMDGLQGLGVDRFDLKFSNGTMSHEKMMRSIELYGTVVKPRVRELLAED